MKRLAIITTHPIQYTAPLFKLLATRDIIDIKVFYTWGEKVLEQKYDPGFGKTIEWDIPLLQGYEHTFVENISKDPGSHHFKGIDNPSLINEILQWRAEAILLFGWSFKSHLKTLRYFHNKIPVFFRGDSSLLNEKSGFSIKKIFRKLFLKWVYSHVDVAFYVGSAGKSYFNKFGLKNKQLVFAPHAIENERFKIKSKKGFRDELGILPGEMVFLFAGKFEPVKNPEFLLKSFSRAELDGVHLVMVGNGELEAGLKEWVRNHQMESKIHFMNFQNQSEMPSIYHSANVFILASQSETWGLGVNEAMAAGLAILVSDKCGCAIDLVENEINGFIFESGNADQLANKMNVLALDKNLVSEMGNQSAIKIQHWSITHICESLEKTMKKTDNR